MKKKWLIVMGTIVLTALATVAFAVSPIKLFVNDQEIKAEVPPQLINGRTMVPIRWVAEALGANVQWEAKSQQVKVSSKKDVWSDQINASDRQIREAVSVMNRYFAYLIGYSPENIDDLATPNALNTDSSSKILQPFMLTGEHTVPRLDIIDVCKLDQKVEVAVRRYEIEVSSSPKGGNYFDEIYTIIWKSSSDAQGQQRDIPLIDGVKLLQSGTTDKIW